MHRVFTWLKLEKSTVNCVEMKFDFYQFIEIPCTFGSLVAFKVTDKCWHGFKPYEGKRLSVQLNYIYPEALRSHNLRHKLSSGLKAIFKRNLGKKTESPDY